jgi:hypothetical protein
LVHGSKQINIKINIAAEGSFNAGVCATKKNIIHDCTSYTQFLDFIVGAFMPFSDADYIMFQHHVMRLPVKEHM